MQTPDDQEIARVSGAWLLLQATKDAQYDWSVAAKEAWRDAAITPRCRDMCFSFAVT